MTTGYADPAGGVRERLARTHEGRLGYVTGRGPRAVVVRFTVSDGRLLFRLPEYSDALGHLPGQPVTLQVAVDGDAGARTVELRVSGTAVVVEGDLDAAAEAALDERWPDGVATHLLALPPTHVELVPAG